MLTTKDGLELNVEELSWNKAHALIKKVLPNLSKVMESYDNDDLKFYKASYRFGVKIFDNGKCYLPLQNGKSLEISSDLLPESLAKDLQYDANSEDPFGIVLSKNLELYLQTGSRVMSHAVISSGYVLGVPRAIEPEEMPTHSRSSLAWNLNSGARSIFFLTRIAARIKHEKLCRALKLRVDVPESMEDECTVFGEVARSINSPWQSEILFFSRDFVNRVKKAEYLQLSNCLMMIHRTSYNVWHNTALIWNAVFSEIEQKKYLMHYSMYSIFTARQLFLIAANSAVGFKPAINDEDAPVTEIKQAYNDIYGFKEDNQSDIMMVPSNLNLEIEDSSYYSINNPMLAEYTPDTFKGKSLINLLEEVFNIVKVYQSTILQEHSHVESLYQIAKTTTFSFYHSNVSDNTSKDIKNSLDLEQEDERLKKFGNGAFPESSAFFKGCVRIIRKP